ncbi:MAG: hypothetical protein RRY35_08150 [Clostridiales bacterium]
MVKEFDLGVVRGAPGPAGVGDMNKSLYDPLKKEQDIFAYADRYRTLQAAANLSAGYWNSATKQATLNLPGVKGSPRENKLLLAPGASATAVQREAWRKGMIYPISQGEDTVTVGADGDVP